MIHWFTKEWWEFLLSKKSPDIDWFTVIKCRSQGHPAGVVYVNTHGLEPDMTCKTCGDDLS